MSLAPQLTTFAENAITAIFQATDKTTFDAAFDSFIATHPTSIVVNGETLTREQYHDKLWDTKFLEAGAQVQFLGAVGNPPGFGKAVSNSTTIFSHSYIYLCVFQGGEVGVFVQATIDEKLLVLGAPETRTVTVSMNLTYVTLPPPSTPPHISHISYRSCAVSRTTRRTNPPTHTASAASPSRAAGCSP